MQYNGQYKLCFQYLSEAFPCVSARSDVLISVMGQSGDDKLW